MLRDVKAEYKVLKEKVKEYNKRDAKFYGNMFAKWSKVEHMEANVSENLPPNFLMIHGTQLFRALKQKLCMMMTFFTSEGSFFYLINISERIVFI